MSRTKSLAAVLGAAVVCTTGGAAQPAASADDLSLVTIIGRTPQDSSGQSATELAGAAQTADAAAIDRAHSPDLAGFLTRRMGSVYVNETQGNPLQPDINYRGYTASPLLGTPQGLSVYMDGVRVNQPFGDVVSWDLIPRAAIQRMELVSGATPLFGMNSLGGALSLHTKDGYSAPGTVIGASYGSHDQRQFELETGGHTDQGLYWYATGNRFRDAGWREASPTDAKQGFGKLGWRDEKTDISLSAAAAQTDLTGNGLQDLRLLSQDYSSVYTIPDETHNRSGLLNLQIHHQVDAGLSLSGNAWYRNIHTTTYNGDVNDGSLGENPYQPNAGERAALTAAGYSGFPTSGENQANTPFPKWRCIANALLNDEPNEKCDGLINRTALSQHEFGAGFEVQYDHDLAGHANRFTAGAVYNESRAHFVQTAQFGYLNADRSITGVTGPGAFADGTQDSENVFDSRVDLGGRTRNESLYFADSLALTSLLRANLAARYDRSTVRNSDNITPGGGSGSLDGNYTYSRLNPALGLVLQATPALSAYLSVSESSRAPSSIELGCADPANPCKLPNAMAGDPPLDEVVTRTYEAGLRGTLGTALAWTATVFRADNLHDILFVADDQAGFGYFRNVDKTRRQGIELGVDGNAATLRYGVHYTLLDATFRSTETLGADGNSSNDADAPGFEGNITVQPGDRIPLIPRQLVKAYAEWQALPQLSLSAEWQYVGGSYARGNENNQHEPDGVYYLGPGGTGGYALLNLGAEWQPTRALTAWVQIANLLDRRYATASQLGAAAFSTSGAFVARPFTAPIIDGERPQLMTTFVAPGAPRSVVAGLRYRFGGT